MQRHVLQKLVATELQMGHNDCDCASGISEESETEEVVDEVLAFIVGWGEVEELRLTIVSFTFLEMPEGLIAQVVRSSL
jgi:hypothetical protein